MVHVGHVRGYIGNVNIYIYVYIGVTILDIGGTRFRLL